MLDQLPTEAVTRICEYTSTSSIPSLLRTCHYLHRVAVGVLYRSLVINATNLDESLQSYTALLDRTQSWNVPRHILVAPSASPMVLALDGIDPNRTGDQGLYAHLGDNCSRHPPQNDSEAHALVAFLRKLPSLCRLTWYIQASPAPLVVHLLRHELPRCTLHLKVFNIGWEAEEEYIWSLLSLPNLRTIWFEDTSRQYTEELVQAACTSSPNLEDVRVFWYQRSTDVGNSEDLPITWLQRASAERRDQLGRLRVLQIGGAPYALGRHLQSWACSTDFAQLRSLFLSVKISQTDLNILATLSFPRLRSLSMGLYSVFDSEEGQQYNASVQSFLCAVAPLSHLRFTGGLPATVLHAILRRHGESLRTLRLIPTGLELSRFSFPTPDILSFLPATCGNVQELSITIRRDWEKPLETIAMLQTIGHFSRLSNLDLTFDALVYAPRQNPVMLDPKYDKHHIRSTFINSAIDAALCEEVFATIGGPSLRQMYLRAHGGVTNGSACVDMGVAYMIGELGRKWTAERQSSTGPIEAWQVQGKRDVEHALVEDSYWEWLEEMEEEADKDIRIDELQRNVREAFKSIWPGNGIWSKQWRAVPLKGREDFR